MDSESLAIVREASFDKSRTISIHVSGCAYACCGKGWQRRDGYEQQFVGYVDNFFEMSDTIDGGTFMLYSRGVGTISYVVAVRFAEVTHAEWA